MQSLVAGQRLRRDVVSRKSDAAESVQYIRESLNLSSVFLLTGLQTPAIAAKSLQFLADSEWTFFDDFAWPYVRSLPWSNKLSLLCSLASAGKTLQVHDMQAQLTEHILEASSNWLISYRNGKLTDRQVTFPSAVNRCT